MQADQPLPTSVSERRRTSSRRARRMILSVAVALVAGSLGCSNPLATPAQTQPSQADSPASSPLTGAVRVRRQFPAVAKEVLQVPGYTYVRVDAAVDQQDVWVATLKRTLAPGDLVNVTLIASREAFFSNHLQRRFAELFFGVVRLSSPAS